MDTILLVPLTVLLLGLGNVQLLRCIRSGVTAGRISISVLALAAGILVLWLTVERWSKWLSGFILGGALKAFLYVSTEWALSVRDTSGERWLLTWGVAVFTLAGALSLSFHRTRPEGYERIALLVFLVSMFPVIYGDDVVSFSVLSAIGLPALLVARLSLRRRRKHRRHKKASPSGAAPPSGARATCVAASRDTSAAR